MSILSLQNVTKDYFSDGRPVRAVDGVTLEIRSNQLVTLVGRSGCGKSTLLNLAGAMDFPTTGEVHIDGVSTAGLQDAALTRIRREKIGFIFQSFQLLHTLSVYENIELPLLLAGTANARATAKEILGWVELDGLGDRLPHQLSGGQMQRVAIARALAHSPKIILADEPTGNLDTVTGNNILQLLQRITRERGTAMLMATHSAEATELADTVVRMQDGKIQQIEQR